MPHLTALRVYDNSAHADPATGKTPNLNGCSTWSAERYATQRSETHARLGKANRCHGAKAAPALILTLQHKPTMRGVPARHRDFGTGVREFVLETGYFSSRCAVGRVIAMCFQVRKSQLFPFAILSDRTIFADSGIPVCHHLQLVQRIFQLHRPRTLFIRRQAIYKLPSQNAARCPLRRVVFLGNGARATLCTLNLEPPLVLWPIAFILASSLS